ncbi:uncharacterized protein [Antedon mediterranea]|uniref:uncharacterized protein n=1 Tax=Antedon mediterranea TaxID=105859 RepID=UPI003AF495FB
MLRLYFILFTVVFAQTQEIEENLSVIPTTCTHKVFKRCGLSMCSEINEVECFHGTCNNATGACDCSHCWTGETCNIPENLHKPVFTRNKIEVALSDQTANHVTTLNALDLDADKCLHKNSCHCSTVLYAIEEGNDDNMFDIDQTTGVIRYTQDLPDDVFDIERTLKISARNPIHTTRHIRSADTQLSSTVDVVISSPEVHSRQRRSAVPTATPTSPVFLVEKLDSFTGITTLKIGEKVPMKLSIWLPADETFDLVVELLTPYESSAIFTICDPTITHVGSNYDGSVAETVVTLDAKNGDKRWDRAVIDFGSISHTGVTSASDASKIVIDYAVILANNNATQDGQTYDVVAGATYNDDIWIAQIAFTASIDRDTWTSSSESVISISGPNEIYKDTCALFYTDMLLPEYGSDIRLDVMAESETEPIMSFASMSVGSYGESYDCMAKDLARFESNSNTSSEFNASASYVFGSITNAGKRSRNGINNDTQDTIRVQIAIHLTDSSEIVDTKSYWIGVSLTVDKEYIHSNKYSVTALTQKPITLANDPSFSFFAADGNDIIIGGYVGLILTFALPETATTELSVEVAMDSDSIMTICSAEVYFIGHNYPCEGVATPTYNNEGDTVTFDFGRITNIGRRSEVSDSTVKIRVVAKMSESAVDGNQYTVTSGVTYSTTSTAEVLWTATVDLTGSQAMPQNYANDDTKIPTLELINRASNNYIYKNSGLSFNMDLIVPSATSFYPFTFEIGVPESSEESLFESCELSVNSVGGSFPCFNENNSMLVEYPYETTSLMVISLGPFTNPVYEPEPTDPNDNKIVFEMHMKLKDHPDINDGDIYNISVNFTYGEEVVIKQMSYEVNLTDPEFTEDNEEPQFELNLDDGRVSALVVGETAVYTMVIYTPTNSVSKYLIDVIAENNTLSVCRADILRSGRNLPCFNDYKANYYSYENDRLVDRALLDLGIVRNSGVTPITNGEDNYLVSQIVVRLDEQVDAQSFDVTVRTGQTHLWSTSRNITFNSGTRTPTYDDLEPLLSFYEVYPIGTVSKGGIAEYSFDVHIPFKSLKSYRLDVSGVSGDATVCQVNLHYAGSNIPCVNGSMLTTVYNTTVPGFYDDIATLDAGVITNMEWVNGTLNQDANVVQFEVIYRVEADTDATSINVAATLTIDDVEKPTQQLTFNVQDALETYALDPIYTFLGPHENDTHMQSSPDIYTIGQKQNFTVNISISQVTRTMSAEVTFSSVSGDTSGEAYLTITNVTIQHIGKNYPCGRFYELDLTYASTHSTSQKDSVTIDLGIISNSFSSHIYQFEEPKPDDDAILIDVEIQLADNYELTDVQQFDVSVEFNGDGQPLSQTIEANKTGSERPELVLDIDVPEYDPQDINPGDLLAVNTAIVHSDTSSAHAFGVFLNLQLPNYITIETVNIDSEPQVTTQTNNDGFQMLFGKMFFTDIFTADFNFSIDPLSTLPRKQGLINTTIPMEVIYYELSSMSGSTPVLGQVYKSKTIPLVIQFTVPECLTSIGGDACNVTASSSFDGTHDAQQGLTTGNGWIPALRDYEKEYIQVLFHIERHVTGIKMFVCGDTDNTVLQFTVAYSPAYVTWVDYKESSEIKVFENAFNDSEHLHILANPFDAIAVRVHPMESGKKLKFDVYGCQAGSPITTCLSEGSTVFTEYDRGVIVDPISGRIFVCVLSYIDGPHLCSYSDDNGGSWDAIDDNIANVIAIINSTREIYGVDQSGHILMRSDDYGTTWYSVAPDSYLEYVDNDVEMVKAEKVPNNPSSDVTLSFTSVTGVNQSIKVDADRSVHSLDSDENWQQIGKM